MRIVFVSFYNDESYGVRILHSILRATGHDVKMLFFKINWPRTPLTNKERELFFQYLDEFKPRLIAFSLVSANLGLYKSFYKELKKLKQYKVLIGGWQASLNPNDSIEHADYICVGEGEEAIPELADKVAKGEEPEGVDNIWYHKDGQIIKQNVRLLNTNLSNFPIPTLDDKFTVYIENNKINYEDPYIRNNRYGTTVGRGCPFKCTYCSNNYMAAEVYPKQWSRIRYREVDYVIQELKHAKEKIPNLESINFYDEIFLPKKAWAPELFRRYKEEINLPFYCMFVPGTWSETLIKMMVPAGLAGVWMGLQSGSERVRKEIFKRNHTNDQVVAQAKLFSKHGIGIKYDLIFDNPFETPEETEETFKLMARLPKPKDFNFFSLKWFPNTEITTMALEQGIITEKDIESNKEIESPTYTVTPEYKKYIWERVRSYE